MGKSDDDSIACRYPALAAQWHPTANGGRTADTVSVAAEFSVWWLCPVGHPFRTKVKWRCASESGCPVCAGRRTRPGINDLATVDSELAAEWREVGSDSAFLRMLSYRSDLVPAFFEFYQPLRGDGLVTARVKELARLRIARLNSCRY